MMRSESESSNQRKPAISVDYVIGELRCKGMPKAVAGMARFGIQTGMALGVSVPQLRELAKKLGPQHDLAQELWKTGIHEARILSSMIDDPAKVSQDQMEKWAADFDSWDVVDGCCGNLFDRTEFAIRKAHEWSKRKEEYVKRAGFVLMAEMAVHDKKSGSRSGNWIAADALRELTSAPVKKRLASRKSVGPNFRIVKR